MSAHLYPGATDAQVDSVADKYSQDPAAVSYRKPSETTF